jgi:uroporphyrinogen decarboxylase
MSSDRPFLAACRGERTAQRPIWMMRQAGRYQPEYLALKERAGGFWGLCTNPEAIAEATLFAQRSLQTDAAIIFSDITVPAWGMGLELEFVPGPKFTHPIRTRDDLSRLRAFDPAEHTPFLLDGNARTRAGLPPDVSLIGFVGAPLTLAGYMIEGYPGRHWLELKRLAYDEPDLLDALLDRLVEAVTRHARAQVEAGCDCIQLFDTTAGQLPPPELRRFAFASAGRVLRALEDLGVPRIYFARDIGAHLEEAAALRPEVLGIDWTVSLSEVRRRVGPGPTLMGNLDPVVLFSSPQTIARKARGILDETANEAGFVFNLGHGILPGTPPMHARHLVETVHAWRAN